MQGEEEQMTEEVEVDEFVITELEEDLYLNYECLKAKACTDISVYAHRNCVRAKCEVMLALSQAAAIAKKNGMKQVKGEALMLLSLAIQWRLRQMLEKMIISRCGWATIPYWTLSPMPYMWLFDVLAASIVGTCTSDIAAALTKIQPSLISSPCWPGVCRLAMLTDAVARQYPHHTGSPGY